MKFGQVDPIDVVAVPFSPRHINVGAGAVGGNRSVIAAEIVDIREPVVGSLRGVVIELIGDSAAYHNASGGTGTEEIPGISSVGGAVQVIGHVMNPITIDRRAKGINTIQVPPSIGGNARTRIDAAA